MIESIQDFYTSDMSEMDIYWFSDWRTSYIYTVAISREVTFEGINYCFRPFEPIIRDKVLFVFECFILVIILTPFESIGLIMGLLTVYCLLYAGYRMPQTKSITKS